MKKDFKLGLVAEINPESIQGIPDEEWRFRFNYFRKKREVIVFDWRDLRKSGYLERYAYGNPDGFGLRKKGNINELSNLVFIGQLGKLYNQKQEFFQFLENLEDVQARLVNPLEALRKNTSKQYLIELYQKGLKVIPTIDVGIKSLEELSDLGIVKPKILGECGNDVRLLSSFKSNQEFQEYMGRVKEAIAQPLIHEIYTLGEDSIVFLNGKISNCINKFTGELRINESCAGTGNVRYTKKEPSEKEIEIAYEALANWTTPFDYARVDMINPDNPIISEIEMINPSCYEIDVGIMPEFNIKLEEFLRSLNGI